MNIKQSERIPICCLFICLKICGFSLAADIQSQNVPLHLKVPLPACAMGTHKLKPHAKFQNPRKTPSGRKVTGSEEERGKEAANSGHYVLECLGRCRVALHSNQDQNQKTERLR